MAPNHADPDDPTSDDASEQATESVGDATAPHQPAADEDTTDTGSLPVSILTAAAQQASAREHSATTAVPSGSEEPYVIDAADLPPVRDSRFDRLWATRQYVGGVPFVARHPLDAARDLVQAAIAGGAGEHVHLANAYSVALANDFPVLAAETFCAGGWNLPDGRPISWLSQLRRDSPALRQVRGPQFMLDVCEEGVRAGLRHYLLGGSPDVLDMLQRELQERFPGIEIVGSFSPPFREPTEEELVARDAGIVASGAHVVWVGLGTPKQDREAARLAGSTGLVAVAVGAAFDYAAGTLQEAPAWMRRIGMEWAFRFAMEPRRLWRRYVFGNVRFIRVALRHGSRPWL